MDTTQVATEAITNNFWIELVKLAVFSVFVTGILEAIKHLLGSLLSPESYTKLLTADRIRLLTFGIALFICQALDYGILQRVIGVGEAAKEFQARWSDFVGTAALCMMGARWAFDKFSTSLASLKAKKEKALA